MENPPAGLHPWLIGGGAIHRGEGGALRLTLPALGRGYADAQWDDTARLPRSHFRHRPPFHAHLRARASRSDPVGTLGFGLWNDPFAFSLGQAGATRKLPAPPQAMWFFYGSPPNDMAYADPGVASGWKAASLRSPRQPGLLVAAGGLGLMAMSWARRWQARAVAFALSRVQAAETRLDVDLSEWHTYDLIWNPTSAEFLVDGEVRLRANQPPDPPLGFVVWIDNQFAVLSRRDGARFGVLPLPEPQWLELAELRLDDAVMP